MSTRIGGKKVFNEKEVQQYVEWLSGIGADPTGGTTRLLYDEHWVKAQNELKTLFEKHDFKTQYDAVGNLFARIEGSEFPEETIMSGSHVDTVVNGGALDGQFGILSAFLAMKYLYETHGQPKRSMEIVSMAEEEGSRFPYAFWGSKNIFGLADKEDVIDAADATGVKFVDAMKQAGFDFRDENGKTREDIKAFVELHIEQGNVLETLKKPVGIVTSIVGQKRYTIRLKGQANHAGTTPMSYRHDTVYAMSRMISQSIEKANKIGDPLVLTFGHVEVVPNTVNVVPGETVFSMDCRHTDNTVLENFVQEIEKDMQTIAQEMSIEIEMERWMDEMPTPMSEDIVNHIIAACDKEELNYHVMHSGAGHDSQIFAPHVPTAMIFVPSIKGISHNPAEATHVSDLVEGVRALTATLYQLAYEK